ncbi:MAG TPA: cyclic nucleotide-binding domain-containing protein [Polyangiaceae bacterium]
MTGAPPSSAAIPPPREDDDDDIAWALQTAQVQWKRGAQADAIVWLRRAADSALSVGNLDRATSLSRAATQLTEQMLSRVPGAASAPESQEPGSDVDLLLGGVSSRLAAPMPSIPIDVEVEEVTQIDSDTERSFTAARKVTTPPPQVEKAAARRPTGTNSPLRPPPPPRAQRPPPPPRPPMPSAPSFVTSAPPLDQVLERRRPGATLDWNPAEASTLNQRSQELPPVSERYDSGAAPSPSFPPSGNTLAAPPPDEAPGRLGYSDSDTTALSMESDHTQVVATDLDHAEDSTESDRTQVSKQPDYADALLGDEDFPPSVQRFSSPRIEPEPEPELNTVRPETAETMAEARIGGIALADVKGLQDLPEEAQHDLVSRARTETLQVEEEVTNFGIALVLEGWVTIMPTIADAACAHANKGDVVFTAGTLSDGIGLRVVAGQDDTTVAIWDTQALEQATHDCPWVADELLIIADRFQALAGVTMGAMGDRLDDSLRSLVTDRCAVRTLLPYEVLVECGSTLPGLHIVGGGRIEIIVETDDGVGEVDDELGPGDFLFAPQVLGGGTAPSTARAGKGGALVLYADRMMTHELLVSVPPLLEILAG